MLALVLLPALTPAWLLYVGLAFLLMVNCARGGLAALLMVHVRVIRQGHGGRLWRSYLALLASAALLLGGVVALVEMTYRLQQSDVLAAQLGFAGFAINVRQPLNWLMVLLIVASSGVLFALCRHRWLTRWHGLGQESTTHGHSGGVA
ncbi:hypothetical protein GALL_429970 [mine drainage metagenome]|uniref:Uncharacterized protein n=1 Tax=mine drainage metagenome TaxID=410659 RepID=A0A1J5QCX6_9ZZZZ